MARTIDDLGVDISTDYANRTKTLEDLELTLREAPQIPRQTQISTTTPYYPSEFDLLFGLSKRGAWWAVIKDPIGYAVSRRRVFVEQVIPILGTPMEQDAKIETFETWGKEEKAKYTNPEEAEEFEQDFIKFLNMLKIALTLNKDNIDINSRRAQYQKG